MTERSVMVGRETELSTLLTALTGAEPTAGVLVGGEAGLGKSRLISALRDSLAEHRVGVAVGHCLPLGTTLPFLPVVDALRELGSGDESVWMDELRRCPPFVAEELARLLPELRRDRQAADVAGSDQAARMRLFDGIRLALAASTRSAVIVIEDLHWADPSTLELLEYLLVEGHHTGVPLVLTGRVAEMDAAWLSRVITRNGLPRVDLVTLSADETSAQIAALLGRTVSREQTAVVHRRTQGHPFHTEQLVRLAGDPATSDLPESLRAVLLECVAHASPDARHLLDVLAVAERPVDDQLLAVVLGRSSTQVHPLLRDLVATRLVTDTERGYELRHALFGEAVRAELLGSERRVWHRRLAQAMQARPDTAPAETAAHFAAAGDDADELRWRVRAAQLAEDTRAAADALVHWRRAAELCTEPRAAEMVTGLPLAEILLRCSWAYEHLGRAEEAADYAERALTALPASADDLLGARIHRVVGYWRGGRSPFAGEQLLRESVRRFEPLPSSRDKARAHWALANLIFQDRGGVDAEQRQLLSAALRVARDSDERGTERMLFAAMAYARLFERDRRAALEQIEGALACPRDVTDPHATVGAAVYAVDLLNKCGEWSRAIELGRVELEWAEQHGYAYAFVAVQLLLYLVEALGETGRVAEATRRLHAGDWSRERDMVDNHLAYLLLLTGDAKSAEEIWLGQRGRVPALPLGFQAEFVSRGGQIDLWAGRPEAVVDFALPVLERCTGTDMSLFCGPLLVLIARACADLRAPLVARPGGADQRTAERAWEQLHRLRAECRLDPFTEPVPGTAAQDGLSWAAELSRFRGEDDSAPWEAAARGWQGLGLPHRAAYARWRQAEALLAQPLGRAAAVPVLREAAVLAIEHAPLTRAVRDLARLARIDLQAAEDANELASAEESRPFGLTDRELTVLRHLGAGQTNAQIARSLYISVSTAGVHVTNILRKLGVTSRVQAAAAAGRLGLLEDSEFRG